MDDGYRIVECDHCGKLRECFFAPDPFMREIYPDKPNPPSWWCDTCWDVKIMDI